MLMLQLLRDNDKKQTNKQTNLNRELEEADKIVEKGEEKYDDGEHPPLACVHWLRKSTVEKSQFQNQINLVKKVD